MIDRKGEKIGWSGGWLGGFIWLALLSIFWLFQNNIGKGMLGLGVFTLAIISIIATAPWRHPNVKYWILMLPIYLLLFISIFLCIYLYGGFESMELRWTALFWVIPCLIPFATVGSRTWNNNA